MDIGAQNTIRYSERQKVILIVGPTASGKSDLAVRLAERIGGEIVNADSMQVYRGMEVGTARPSRELMSRVPHHLFGIVDPEVNFTAADYIDVADRAIAEIRTRGKIPVVVGGTGLYIRALLCGLAESPSADEVFRGRMSLYAEQNGPHALHDLLAQVDPESAARLHVNDRVRIIRALEVFHQAGRPLSVLQDTHGFAENRYDALKIGLNVDRELLYERINRRVEGMVAAGLVAEVEGLLSRGYSPELKALGAIGYREICDHLRGKTTLFEAVDLIKCNSRRYAKRQITWFKKDPAIIWFESSESFANIIRIACDFNDRRNV